ncbi:MAG TPA: 4,5-DOPA dioxygenase extradiol, partial [Nevskia sp.]|nr:4,5-DOPA dioxygenase extradiol [Nevskia sp.]
MSTPSTANPVMPALFLGHGSPMNAIEDNPCSREWAALGRRLPRPRAILCISAHWETHGIHVTAAAQPETIHDFHGFPKALFDVRYPAPGSPELARRVAELIGTAPGSHRVQLDPHRGLDHGAWSVLRPMYPQADIPVVQLSLDSTRPGDFHLALGRRLAPLREEGVLILGSGDIVHNLRLYSLHGTAAMDWALRFRTLANRLIENGDDQALADYPALGADAQLAIPTPEHYLPLLYVLGARSADERPVLFNDMVTSSL